MPPKQAVYFSLICYLHLKCWQYFKRWASGGGPGSGLHKIQVFQTEDNGLKHRLRL